MRQIFSGIFFPLLLAFVCAITSCAGGPSLQDYEHLLQPRITDKPDEKVLQVTTTGDPNEQGQNAFGLLFNIYYRMDGAPKGPAQPAPKARWPESFDTPVSEWIGLYAMQVPDSIETLPSSEPVPGCTVELTVWEYGVVAEILHVGSYAAETPTIETLHRFIADQGYEITGHHEEEYLKGPGMWGVSEKDYLTIIRYQISKAGG